MARVLRPGGRIRGTTVVRGSGLRQDTVISLFRRRGIFGDVGTARDVSSWLAMANFDEIHVARDGAVAFFSALRGSAKAEPHRSH
jgi:hypothetical protein